ncbi:iron-containing alcohol dehydrogenase [Lactonifactor longoviformis]|uniref:iron-containing alcohol dehydrogenase n=1 Tax=Lactonifactor longoviformis TaxID=341220 RepID=UPI001D022D43|nr:iron-containing alcohol dehydrogenase [Lactonifactor longoviformis]MCB5713349.1 iron-containing alcohol dehydrogenase [Lactonifactor longoviformis]MCB5716651.1 iron-containing alcohol dehydrogenase [Lactonifactor longoviformis]
MMRPMKLAGSQLLFGRGCLEHIKSLEYKRVVIVLGGSSMVKSGMLDKVRDMFKSSGAEVAVIEGVEPDPSFATVKRGAKEMLAFRPDLIVALGGGSVMDAGKTMWIYYEHPELETLEDVLQAVPFPKLREKAHFCCIPSTAGTASEVSRSVVISDTETGMKHGIGNMEMMPDIAICDPEVTLSMPARITAETGMDALTHAIEALVSTRANYIGDTLALQAALDIMEYLPQAYANGGDLEIREKMLNASMAAGLAFTNVSLGIVHSMAHTLGGYFHVPHGLGDAMLLPYIIEFNSQDERAAGIYRSLAEKAGGEDLAAMIRELNGKLHIPASFQEIIKEEEKYNELLEEMAKAAKADGCTKTNPVIPELDQFKALFQKAYKGE